MAERVTRPKHTDEKFDAGVMQAVDEARREMKALRSSDRFTVGHLSHFERLDAHASCRDMRSFTDSFSDESRP